MKSEILVPLIIVAFGVLGYVVGIFPLIWKKGKPKRQLVVFRNYVLRFSFYNPDGTWKEDSFIICKEYDKVKSSFIIRAENDVILKEYESKLPNLRWKYL